MPFSVNQILIVMKRNDNISQEKIKNFMEGERSMDRIVNITYNYQNSYVTVFYRDENDNKCAREVNFYPFCWATRYACERLCNGDRREVKKLMNKYHIGVRKLSNTAADGTVVESYDNGYMFMFYATKPMSNAQFGSFFKAAGNSLYAKKDNNGVDTRPLVEQKQYLTVTPVEQFMISSGQRFFKGYLDYNDVLRMIFDLETEGLDPHVDRIKLNGIRFNRSFTHNNQRIENFEQIFRIEGETEEEKDKSELGIIRTMLQIIYTFKPDVITAHNGENFDWDFIIERCKMLGTTMEDLSRPYFTNNQFIFKEKRPSILKLGGEIESYYQTIVPDTVVTDSLHAVRRAQALDSNMLKADLKYATKYSKMVKPNRVYVPGDIIDKTLVDTECRYAFNDIDGDWYIYDKDAPYDKDCFVRGKDTEKFRLYTHNYLKDGYTLVNGKYIVERYLLDDLWECDKVEWKYNSTNFLICKLLPVPYKKCTTMGTAGQWKSLMLAWSYENGLAIPMPQDKTRFTGGLSRLLRTGFVTDVVKLDYNSLYPSIDLHWGISDDKDLMGVMPQMLNYVLTGREHYKGDKKKYGKIVDSLKKKIQDGTATDEENRQYNEASANYAVADGKQIQLKCLGNSFFGSYGATNVFPWGSMVCAEQITCTGRQSLRLMISHFSKLGYSPIVGDTDGFNFKLPSTHRYTDENPYISNGKGRNSKAGKAYVGLDADICEFEDLYLGEPFNGGLKKMGLGLDECVDATINFSRKNYADYFPENPFPDDVKMVGNTIKSKKMPEYISQFLSKGIRLLLKGDGVNFIEEYYKWVEKIYNYQIPLRDIATKGKIKKSLNEYIDGTKELTKAGRPKSRQAWYELAIVNKLNVHNGDTIYYINTGTKKSQSDIKKITHYMQRIDGVETDITKEAEREYKKYTKDLKDKGIEEKMQKNEWISKEYKDSYIEEEIKFNCNLLPQWIIESEQNLLCSDIPDLDIEYNTEKYISAFNSRIMPLLVCFSKEIRDNILVTDPNNRSYFTKEQCQLVSGEPNNPGDQDSYEQLMTIEDKEFEFWTKNNLTPPFVEECGMGKWEDLKEDYFNRKREEKKNGIDKIRTAYEKAYAKLTKEQVKAYVENGTLPPKLNSIVKLDTENGTLVAKKYPDVVIANMFDIAEKEFSHEYVEDVCY